MQYTVTVDGVTYGPFGSEKTRDAFGERAGKTGAKVEYGTIQAPRYYNS